MATVEAKVRPRVIIEAVVTRANGKVENLGVIASSDNNTVKVKNGFFDLFKRKGQVK